MALDVLIPILVSLDLLVLFVAAGDPPNVASSKRRAPIRVYARFILNRSAGESPTVLIPYPLASL